jgi:hypothetical protein
MDSTLPRAARVSSWTRTHSSSWARRIAGRGHGAAGLVGVLDERDDQALDAQVEEALHQHRIVPGHAHDRRGRPLGHRPELGEDRRQLVGSVLRVEDEEVETRAGEDLDGGGAGELAPQADLRPSLAKRPLERVRRQLHRPLLRGGRDYSIPSCQQRVAGGVGGPTRNVREDGTFRDNRGRPEVPTRLRQRLGRRRGNAPPMRPSW